MLLPISASGDPLQTWNFRFSENSYYYSNGWVRHYDTVFGNGSFVAVGHLSGTDFGTIYTSPDGVQWTRRSQFPFAPNQTYGELRAITYAAGMFVTVGWAGTIYTSSDAVNWVLRRSPAPSGFGLNDICHGRGIFVAVGDPQDSFGSLTQSNILTSNNGVDWTPVRAAYSPGVYYFFTDVASSGSSFVANGTTYVLASSDGVRWTLPPVSLPGYAFDLTFANGLYVAVGQTPGGNGMILTSSNGLQWTARSPGVTNRLLSVTYGMGMFLATGDAVVLTSINGIHWSPHPAARTFRRPAIGNGSAIALHEQYDLRVSEIYQAGPILRIQPTPGAPNMFALYGPPSQTVRIETSDALANDWQHWRTVTLGANPYQWTPDQPLSSKRFYRAATQ
jgi:hypothetical protein